MNDLISREAAIDKLYKMLHDCFWADDEELDAVITTLNDLPSAEPERKTGRWREHYDRDDCMYFWDCSVCHNISHKTFLDKTKYRYCPHCGAKMEGTGEK